MEPYYPFQMVSEEKMPWIYVYTLSYRYGQYRPLFHNYGYKTSGLIWSAHIIQILEEQAPSLLHNTVFCPNKPSVYVYFDSYRVLNQFQQVLAPIFQDFNLLEKFIQKADTERLNQQIKQYLSTGSFY
jgi:hypothetical protein